MLSYVYKNRLYCEENILRPKGRGTGMLPSVGLSGKDFLELKFEQASDKSKGYKSKSLFDSWMKQMVNSKIDVCLVYFRYKNG